MNKDERHLRLFEESVGPVDFAALLKEGQNAYVYKVTSNKNSFVVRVGYKEKQSGSSLATSAKVLDALNKAKYKHSAQKILYSQEQDILIETFLEGKSKKVEDFNDTELEYLVSALVSLYKIPIPDIHNIPFRSALEDIDVYGTQRLKIIQEKLPEEGELIEWLQSELDENIGLIKRSSKEKNKPFLIHGDIGNNLLIQNDKVVFFDWEHSRLSCQHELSYIKIHSHPSVEQLTYIVSSFSKKMESTEENLWREIQVGEKITRLGDVIWAAMRWGETKKVDLMEGALSHKSNSFKELTNERKDLYLNFKKKC